MWWPSLSRWCWSGLPIVLLNRMIQRMRSRLTSWILAGILNPRTCLRNTTPIFLGDSPLDDITKCVVNFKASDYPIRVWALFPVSRRGASLALASLPLYPRARRQRRLSWTLKGQRGSSSPATVAKGLKIAHISVSLFSCFLDVCPWVNRIIISRYFFRE